MLGYGGTIRWQVGKPLISSFMNKARRSLHNWRILEAKEAVSLINGTQGMLAVGILALLTAETLMDSADVIGSLTLDALRGTDVAFDERIHRARPHPGQLKTAENLRRMLEGSQIRESHRDCDRVQDAYSLRCMPQVHGAVRDTQIGRAHV